MKIQYKKGYRFQTVSNYSVFIGIRPKKNVETQFLTLTSEGQLQIRSGYAWDGASGRVTIQTRTIMRGSLVHDALYQLCRMELLHKDFRELADIELKKICKEDGMWSVRAWYVFEAVRWFGASSADPRNVKKVFIAP